LYNYSSLNRICKDLGEYNAIFLYFVTEEKVFPFEEISVIMKKLLLWKLFIGKIYAKTDCKAERRGL
jgi:hypothetical protein